MKNLKKFSAANQIDSQTPGPQSPGIFVPQSVLKSSLPFGDFQMHDQTVESVITQGRKEDMLLGDQSDVYLRFGLPRVALPGQG